MRPSMKNNNGFVLIAALLCMVVLFILGPIFMTLSMTETQIAFNDKNATRALYVAEMAVERARRDIKYDADFDLGGITNQYFASPTPVAMGQPANCVALITWQGVPPQQRCYDLGGPIPAEPVVVPPYPADNIYFQTLYTNVNVDTYGDGSTYDLKLGLLNSNKMTLRAEGTGPLQSRKTVDVRVEVRDLSVWNNAIFAGGSGTGLRINGNVVIAGSVHILGQGLGPAGTAADFGGGGGIFNWYNGLDVATPGLDFVGKLPPNPSTLDAEIRVKEGRIEMNSGTARAGNGTADVDVDGNPIPAGIKRRIDGTYTEYGYAGSFGDQYVYSDNGLYAKYDLPADFNISFPSLCSTGPPCGLPGTHEFWLDANSWDPLPLVILVAPNATNGTDLTIDDDAEPFDIVDGMGNRLGWDDVNQVLTVEGIIRIPGSITLGRATGPDKLDPNLPITYATGATGGTLYAKKAGANWSDPGTGGAHEDSITISHPLLPAGVFPTGDTLGLIAKDRILMDGSTNNVAAAVFAENQVKMTKQYQVVGAVVTQYFDLGTNTPRVYQMPNLAKYLPPGMPGGQVFNFVKILSWREI